MLALLTPVNTSVPEDKDAVTLPVGTSRPSNSSRRGLNPGRFAWERRFQWRKMGEKAPSMVLAPSLPILEPASTVPSGGVNESAVRAGTEQPYNRQISWRGGAVK